MTSIRCEVPIRRPAADTWSMLKCFGDAARLFAPVLTDCAIDGDVRTVTFANGNAVRERLIGIDDRHRRLCYTVLGDTFDHHSASIEIVPIDDRTCRLVWISDFLPDERSTLVGPLMEQGCQALVVNVERGAPATQA